MQEYSYLVLIFMLGLVWFFFFMKRKDLRHEQLLMSFLVTPCALTQMWFYHDYWRPPEYIFTYFFGGIPIGIEDFLFCFLIGGIGSVAYEFFTNRNHRSGKKNHFLVFVGILFAGTVFLSLEYFNFNTVWATSAAFVLGACLLVTLNRALLRDFVGSGLIVCALLFSIYLIWLLIFPNAVEKLWLENGLSDVKLSRVPLEEIIWYLTWGMFGGVLYESWINVKAYPLLRKIKS